MRQIFLGWGQGSSWGSPFAELFAGLKPIPMIHIGTDRGRAPTEAITPAGIAAGLGDAYLVALNQAVAAYGGRVYVRVMAEMNNPQVSRRRGATAARRDYRIRRRRTGRRSGART